MTISHALEHLSRELHNWHCSRDPFDSPNYAFCNDKQVDDWTGVCHQISRAFKGSRQDDTAVDGPWYIDDDHFWGTRQMFTAIMEAVFHSYDKKRVYVVTPEWGTKATILVLQGVHVIFEHSTWPYKIWTDTLEEFEQYLTDTFNRRLRLQ